MIFATTRLMRILLLTLTLAFLLKAQLPPLPDTLWSDMSTRDSSNWTEYRVWRSRSSPIISETWRRTRSSDWQLRRQDTLLLNRQGQIERYALKYYYFNNQNQRDSSILQVLFSYPTPTQTQMELQEWDKDSLRWQPLARLDWTAPSQDPRDILESYLGIFLGGYLSPPAPSLYKRAHLGDTLRYYEWDTLSTPPNWAYVYGYARKSGACDSLIELPSDTSSTSWDVSFCFDPQGKLLRQRDSTSTTSDTSVTYRFVSYDAAGRVMKDSTESLDYDGQGNVSFNSRRLTTYTYDSQGRLAEVEERHLYQRGGPLIGRMASKPFNWPVPSLQRTHTSQADTVVYYWRYVYSAPSSVEGLFQSGCFSYAMPTREGRFGCLTPTAKISLSLYDLTGRLVWQGEVTGTQPSFCLPESLPAGLYLLRAGESALRLYLAP